MPRLRIEQTQSLQMQPEMRQVLRMEQADLLEMAEGEFAKLIVSIEQSALFNRLYRQKKLIRRQRFPRTDISPQFYQLEEGIIADRGSADVETLLENKKTVIQKIQKLGEEKFRRYFLFPETGMSREEIAAECGLEIAEVNEINGLTDELSIMSEFYHPSAISSATIHYTKVATVERDEKGFIIGYFSALAARGKYVIDYAGFEELRQSGALGDAEVREARRLFRKLELINSRTDTLTHILQNIVNKQALYLESGNRKALLPFYQKELARRLEVAPSAVSRAIRDKSLETPHGEEVPLKYFFPTPKKFRLELLRQLLEEDKQLASDEAIRNKLWEKFGVAISRRSVANLRKQLKIPAAYGKPNSATARR